MATGTKVADVFVDIGYDLTQYRKGLAQAKAEAQGIGGQIRAALSGAPGIGKDQPFTSGFAQVVKDIRAGTPVLAAFRAHLPAVGRDLAKLSVSGLTAGLHGLGTVATRVFGGLRTFASNVFKGIALGAGITAFLGLEQIIARITRAIPDLIEKGKEWAEAIHTVTLATGATAEEASRQAAAYKFLGGETAQYVTQVVRLSARLKQHEDRLTALGVVLRDQRGNWLDQITIIDNLRKVFSKLPDGVDKTRLAFQLFGQRGAQMFGPLIHYIGLTDEQVKLLAADAARQGLIVSDSTTKLGDAVDKARNRIGNALTGLGTTLFVSLGPSIVTFFDSVAEAISANAETIRTILGQITGWIVGFVQGLAGLNPAVDSFSTQFARIDKGGADVTATILDLQDQLDQLGESTGGATRAIQRQTDALKALERQQDKTYKKALDSLYAQLVAQNKLLDAEEQRLGNADRDLRLARALRDAKLGLAQAQAQLQEDQQLGKPTDRDIVDLAHAQEALLDAQKAIGEEGANRLRDQRRAELTAVKEYIDSIEKLVSESEDRKATLAELGRDKTSLETQRAAALAAGNAQKAADLQLEIEAVAAAAIRAKQQTENEKRQAALDAQTAAIGSAASEQTAILKRSLEDQIANLQKWQRKQDLITSDATKDFGVLADVQNRAKGGLPGLGIAIDAVRQKGLDFAKRFREGLVGTDGKGGVLGAIRSVADALGHLFDGLIKAWSVIPDQLKGVVAGAIVGGVVGGPLGAAAGAITGGALQLNAENAKTDAQRAKVLADTQAFAKTATSAELAAAIKGLASQRKLGPMGTKSPEYDFIGKLIDLLSRTLEARVPGHATGLWNSPDDHLAFIHRREMVLPPAIADAVRSVGVPQMPAFAMAGAGGSDGSPAIIRVEIGGNLLLDYIDRGLRYRRR